MNYKKEAGLPYPQPWEFVLTVLKNAKNLRFVDVGAYDGLVVSNTAYMEMDLGWTGVCIEPNPAPFSKLQLNRISKNYNCCISEKECNLDFICVEGYAEMLSCLYSDCSVQHMQRITDEISKHGGSCKILQVKSKTLNDVFEENEFDSISYLSVDTEGAELSVVRSLDYAKYKVDIISIENNNNDAGDYLVNNGYSYITTVCGDAIFKLK